MKRTTIFLDEAVEHDLRVLARRKGVPVAALLRESLNRYLAEENRGQAFALRFLGAGHSGWKDVAERHEELLWRDLKPQDRAPAAKKRRSKVR
jgi:hypothetical protein